MKRVSVALLALVLSAAMVCPVFAADFVPSIGNKPAPSLVEREENGEKIIGHVRDKDGNILTTEHEDCLIITPISEAETSEEIPDEAAELLLKVYNEFVTGGQKISGACPELNDLVKEALGEDKDADDLVIKDMFDVTAICDELKRELPIDGNVLDLTFDVGIAQGTFVQVMVYVDGQWQLIESVTNNGDGTITCVFEDICPVAILVPEDAAAGIGGTPNTGDMNGTQIVTWSVMAGVSLVAMVAAVVVYRRKMSA